MKRRHGPCRVAWGGPDGRGAPEEALALPRADPASEILLHPWPLRGGLGGRELPDPLLRGLTLAGRAGWGKGSSKTPRLHTDTSNPGEVQAEPPSHHPARNTSLPYSQRPAAGSGSQTSALCLHRNWRCPPASVSSQGWEHQAPSGTSLASQQLPLLPAKQRGLESPARVARSRSPGWPTQCRARCADPRGLFPSAGAFLGVKRGVEYFGRKRRGQALEAGIGTTPAEMSWRGPVCA